MCLRVCFLCCGLAPFIYFWGLRRSIFLVSSRLMLQGQNVLHSFIFGVYGGLSSSSTIFPTGLQRRQTTFPHWCSILGLSLDIEDHILGGLPWCIRENYGVLLTSSAVLYSQLMTLKSRYCLDWMSSATHFYVLVSMGS